MTEHFPAMLKLLLECIIRPSLVCHIMSQFQMAWVYNSIILPVLHMPSCRIPVLHMSSCRIGKAILIKLWPPILSLVLVRMSRTWKEGNWGVAGIPSVIQGRAVHRVINIVRIIGILAPTITEHWSPRNLWIIVSNYMPNKVGFQSNFFCSLQVYKPWNDC